jgi:hypothetical protein
MNLTKEQAAALGRKQAQPQKAPGELLAIWVSGRLKNPLNAGWGAAKWEHGYRQRWKERVSMALLEDDWWKGIRVARNTIELRTFFGPKRVVFLAGVHQKFDSDGLQAALKPVRDALVECGVVSGDAERDGHLWEYGQVIDRARRGVTIRVSLR